MKISSLISKLSIVLLIFSFWAGMDFWAEKHLPENQVVYYDFSGEEKEQLFWSVAESDLALPASTASRKTRNAGEINSKTQHSEFSQTPSFKNVAFFYAQFYYRLLAAVFDTQKIRSLQSHLSSAIIERIYLRLLVLRN